MSNSTNSKINYNTNLNSPTIQRCPHDRENPYAQIKNDLIRDLSLSPACFRVLIYLLSHRDNWVINVRQLWNTFKNHIGRDAMFKLINEACEAGYMMREEYKEGNLRRIRYYLSEEPKFKKCFRRPEKQDPAEKDVEATGKNESHIIHKERTLLRKQQPPKEKKPQEKAPSAVVVPSLNKLEITETLKRKISKEKSVLEIDTAVDRCLAWKTRKSHAAALQHWLNHPDDWVENQGKKDREEAEKYLETLKRIDGKKCNGVKVIVGKNYIQFDAGSAVKIFNVEEPDFVLNVKAYLEKIKEKAKK